MCHEVKIMWKSNKNYKNAVYSSQKSESLPSIYFLIECCTIFFSRVIERWSKNDHDFVSTFNNSVKKNCTEFNKKVNWK